MSDREDEKPRMRLKRCYKQKYKDKYSKRLAQVAAEFEAKLKEKEEQLAVKEVELKRLWKSNQALKKNKDRRNAARFGEPDDLPEAKKKKVVGPGKRGVPSGMQGVYRCYVIKTQHPALFEKLIAKAQAADGRYYVPVRQGCRIKDPERYTDPDHQISIPKAEGLAHGLGQSVLRTNLELVAKWAGPVTEDDECSHLCHCKGCVIWWHMVVELRSNNLRRNKCASGVCSCGLTPVCYTYFC
jgi:hypothetical protein